MWSNRALTVLWILFGVIYIFQGYTQWLLSNAVLGVVLILFGAVACAVCPFLALRRSRISVDDAGVRIPQGQLWTEYLPWDGLDRLRMHRMGVEFERSDGRTASLHFGLISYGMIQTLRPEIQSHLKQIAESKGIPVVEDG